MASTFPPREPMRNVDKAWLDMDTPTNLMIINGVLLFDTKIEYARFVDVVDQRFVRPFRRFRQRIVNRLGPGGVAWEIDPHFDLSLHVRHLALPEPGDTRALQTLVSNLVSESLDPHRPLWRFYLVDNYEGGCAAFVRLHHCIADGIALIQVLLSLTDDHPGAPATSPGSSTAAAPLPEPEAEPGPTNDHAGETSPRAPRVRRRNSSMASSIWALRDAAAGAGRLLKSAAALTLHVSAQTATNPHHLLEAAYTAGLISVTTAAILGKLLVLPPDNDSAIKGELGAKKQVIWSEPISLERVKEIGRANGATINDVLVAAVAGALRRYMLEHGGPVDVRAMVPVNLRDPRKSLSQLGNEFALVYLNLPVNEPVAERRLREVKRQMDMLKQSPEPMLIYEILNVIGLFPGEMAEWATTWFSGKASTVLTNVPGPRNQLYFCGQPVRKIMFWVPQSGRIGMGISIMSYFGEVSLGVMVDDGLIAEPAEILAGFEQELDWLASAGGNAPEAPSTQDAPGSYTSSALEVIDAPTDGDIPASEAAGASAPA